MAESERPYPITSFFFTVSIDGINGTSDGMFQQLSGIEWERDGKLEVREGGLNGYKHSLPMPVTHPDLELKRGVLPDDSALTQWCTETLSADFGTPIEPKTITVQLTDGQGNVLRGWTFYNAYPHKMGYSSLDAMRSEYLVENLVFAYDYCEAL
ncbi:hypothetical protein FUAX_24370 [Fulvitalea axinellae]|uniref:Phage tail protein n=1 Tax=Fulvitalea axinellae TaxID=1182444 RepID=A0AAU9DC74_9BACT|nr:hypothetical protein FUAX_24370 [Fulvitalea axinellae]